MTFSNALTDTTTGLDIPMTMQRLEITGDVFPLGSSLQVLHRFRCEGTSSMEAIYIFALPTGGVLRRFKVQSKGYEVVSKLEPRKEALKTYEQGLSQGHLSTLAEVNPDGLVQISVGQIQPGEAVSILLDIIVGVTTKDQGYSFRFPFTLAPCYHPEARVISDGNLLEMQGDIFESDVSLPEWLVDQEGLHEVGFSVRVFGGDHLSVSSPSHLISVSPQAGGPTTVSLAVGSAKPDRDLVIDVALPKAEPLLYAESSLQEDSPKWDARWTAVLPSTSFGVPSTAPRKVVFVLDHSGSMEGGPLVKAKKSLLACLSTLGPEDLFGIVRFSSGAECFHSTLVSASDVHRERALKWVEETEVQGATDMLLALTTAMEVLNGKGDIFLITDGEVYATGPIIENMASTPCRVHVLGIGTSSQHRFMAALARRTDGVSDMVPPEGDVSHAGLRLFNRVVTPILKTPVALIDDTCVQPCSSVWVGYPLMLTSPEGVPEMLSSLVVGTSLSSYSPMGESAAIHLVNLSAGAGGPPVREYRYWSYSGSFIDDLAHVMEDGGMPGSDYEKGRRLANTILMALLVSQESGMDGVYAKHIQRMLVFISEGLKEQGAAGSFLLRRVRKSLQEGCSIPRERLEELFDSQPHDLFQILKPELRTSTAT